MQHSVVADSGFLLFCETDFFRNPFKRVLQRPSVRESRAGASTAVPRFDGEIGRDGVGFGFGLGLVG
jgi:hypothetical protein